MFSVNYSKSIVYIVYYVRIGCLEFEKCIKVFFVFYKVCCLFLIVVVEIFWEGGLGVVFYKFGWKLECKYFCIEFVLEFYDLE